MNASLDAQLFDAIVRSDVAQCTDLLGRGANAQAWVGDDWSTLLSAAKHNQQDTISRLLLEHGAKVDAANSHKWGPLHWAACKGHAPTCRVLFEFGAAINATDNARYSPLHLAADKGHTPVCLMLLDHGADPLIRNMHYRTALCLAIKNNHKACAGVIQSVMTANAARTALQEIGADSVLPKASQP